MAGFLTTHVLDTARGIPAAGMAFALYRLAPDGARQQLTAAITNADGRTDQPVLPAPDFTTGRYELLFQVGAYFGPSDDLPFLDEVPVRFGISDASAHYHVPLLVSPFSFSTYRGS